MDVDALGKQKKGPKGRQEGWLDWKGYGGSKAVAKGEKGLAGLEGVRRKQGGNGRMAGWANRCK